MKIPRFVIILLIIILLIVVYSASIKLIKHEDFIGAYRRVSINPDIIMEFDGKYGHIIDQKKDEEIICYIDSVTVVDDAIYGIAQNKFFLLTISNKNVFYSSIPVSQYSTCRLLTPLEYYNRKTMHIDIVGLFVLLCCIILIIKIGFFHVPKVRAER